MSGQLAAIQFKQAARVRGGPMTVHVGGVRTPCGHKAYAPWSSRTTTYSPCSSC